MKIAVDLTPMRQGGENGGVKLATMEFLKGLQACMEDELQFLFFTADDTHDEVASILRERDLAFAFCDARGEEAFFKRLNWPFDQKCTCGTCCKNIVPTCCTVRLERSFLDLMNFLP